MVPGHEHRGLAEELDVEPRRSRPGWARSRAGPDRAHRAPPGPAACRLRRRRVLGRPHMTYPSPFTQIAQPLMMSLRTVWGLFNPRSDIGLSKVRARWESSTSSTRPQSRDPGRHQVHDPDQRELCGAQPPADTRPRRRPDALRDHRAASRQGAADNFIAATQSVFMVLLLSMVLYISFFDVRRWNRDVRDSRPQAQAAPRRPRNPDPRHGLLRFAVSDRAPADPGSRWGAWGSAAQTRSGSSR